MYYPEIEEDIPLPANATEALPELSATEEIDMRARTIKFLSDLTGAPIIPDAADQRTAEIVAREMLDNPESRHDFSAYPNETMAFLAGMVAQSNVKIVDELSDLKMYVVNKLIYEVEHAPDSKTRITALAKLGEVDGVDAFKKRSEVTMQVKPLAEVEKELLETLNVIETRFLEVKKPEITQHAE